MFPASVILVGMTDEQFFEGLNGQMRAAPALALDASSRVVVISDLHMGDGSSNDDFRRNGELLASALERHYLSRGSTLILNGDIEDIQKFRLARIRSAWRPLFAIFDRFAREGRLYKICGNHDDDLLEASRYPYPLHQGVRLGWGPRMLYVFHGHQASGFLTKHNDLSGAVIRYVFHNLRIRNRSPSKDSGRRYRIERRIYDFSRNTGIVSVIGHTHRPLFESLSKYDRLRFEIERLCAEYSEASAKRKAEIAETRSGPRTPVICRSRTSSITESASSGVRASSSRSCRHPPERPHNSSSGTMSSRIRSTGGPAKQRAAASANVTEM